LVRLRRELYPRCEYRTDFQNGDNYESSNGHRNKNNALQRNGNRKWKPVLHAVPNPKNMNVMKMRMYRRRCHVCGKVCNTTTLAAICARCRNIKRDTKMICGDAFSREHNNDVAKQPNEKS